ncbi:MAG: hypothetical protein AAF790_09540 [Planctomycetota bacterium]
MAGFKMLVAHSAAPHGTLGRLWPAHVLAWSAAAVVLGGTMAAWGDVQRGTPKEVAARATPYVARIAQAEAPIYSGPGNQFYTTGRLPRGAAVEVHRADGRFLAIRPPRGSFSVVPAADLSTAASGLATVVRSGVASRVGGLHVEQRSVVHVRLTAGETVRVLGSETTGGVERVRIAPPSGEFRWVHSDAVTRDEAPPEPAMSEPSGVAPEPAAFAAEATPLAGWIGAVQPATADQPAAADSSGGVAAAAAELSPTPNPSGPAPVADSPASQAAATPAASPAIVPLPVPQGAAFADRLRALEIELARRVAEPVNLWRLEDVEQSAAALLRSAGDEQQRGAVRAFGARVDRFATLAGRRRGMRGVAATGPAAASTPPSRSPVALPRPPSTPASTALVGELRRVVSRDNRADAPAYAVIDAKGRVLSFVTPQPGMDLSRLVGKRVSVAGVQGYLPAIQSRHVSATRVAQLPPTLR